MPNPVYFVIKHVVLPKQTANKTVRQIMVEAGEKRAKFDEALLAYPADGKYVSVRKAELASAADVLAHMEASARGYQEAVSRLLAKNPTPIEFEDFEPFVGARGRDWGELWDAHQREWTNLIELFEQSEDNGFKVNHIYFGQIGLKDWAALTKMHYFYHARQLRTFQKRLPKAIASKS